MSCSQYLAILSYLGYWSQNLKGSLQKPNTLCAQSSHVWGDSSHGCSSGMMSRTNNCKSSMLQSQLFAKAYDSRFYCRFTFVYWGRISSSKSRVLSVWSKIKLENQSDDGTDEHQLIILYRHIIFKGVFNLDHCFQVWCSHF